MKPFDTLANEIGSLAAETAETRAHCFRIVGSRFGHRHATAIKAKSFVGNPSALTTGWGNPDTGFSTRVNDGQRPLRLKLNDLGVRNPLSLDWVDNMDTIFLQNHFWSNPKQVNGNSQDGAENEIYKSLESVARDDEAIGSEEQNQNKCCTSPNKVASWSKGFSHRIIIAGEAE